MYYNPYDKFAVDYRIKEIEDKAEKDYMAKIIRWIKIKAISEIHITLISIQKKREYKRIFTKFNT